MVVEVVVGGLRQANISTIPCVNANFNTLQRGQVHTLVFNPAHSGAQQRGDPTCCAKSPFCC